MSRADPARRSEEPMTEVTAAPPEVAALDTASEAPAALAETVFTVRDLAVAYGSVPRRGARCDPHGRTVRITRPDRHESHRGPPGGAQARLHDRDCHPQHATGGAGLRRDRLLHH